MHPEWTIVHINKVAMALIRAVAVVQGISGQRSSGGRRNPI